MGKNNSCRCFEKWGAFLIRPLNVVQFKVLLACATIQPTTCLTLDGYCCRTLCFVGCSMCELDCYSVCTFLLSQQSFFYFLAAFMQPQPSVERESLTLSFLSRGLALPHAPNNSFHFFQI